MEVNGLPIVKLGEILPAPYKNGIYKHSDSYGSGTRILRITDFDNNGNLVNGDLRRVELTPKEAKNYRLQNQDIVVNRVNSLTHLGKSILWNEDRDVAIVYESNMMRIEPDTATILPEFLIRILQSYNARSHFRKVAKRAVAQCSISQQDVKSLKFPLPPILEQKKIAQILSTWDQAITATERLLENSKQRKKGLMQQFLTGKKRLPGFEGEWKEGHLKDISAISKGKALSSKDLKNGTFPVVAGGKTSPYTHESYTHDHAITVSASGAYAGYVAYHEYKFWASDCSVVEATDASDIEFLYHLMTWNQEQIYTLQSGGAQPHVYPKDLHAIRLQIPMKEEQQAIANVLTTASREIDLLKSQLDDFKQEKKALMQQLLTGKRRIKLKTEAA